MPYPARGNPYNTSYAIPRYVLEEKERRAIATPKSAYLTISHAEVPVNVAAKAPRGTVSVAPPLDFRAQTGKIYPVTQLGSLGGGMDGGSLGANAACTCGGTCPSCRALGADPAPSSTGGWIIAGALGLVAYLMTRRS